jgi:hypothetical protein
MSRRSVPLPLLRSQFRGSRAAAPAAYDKHVITAALRLAKLAKGASRFGKRLSPYPPSPNEVSVAVMRFMPFGVKQCLDAMSGHNDLLHGPSRPIVETIFLLRLKEA